MRVSLSKKSKAQLDIANKLIFVKSYDEASEILKDLIDSDEGRSELLAHLRYIELSTKLKTLEKVCRYYEGCVEKYPELRKMFEVCVIFAHQHAEYIDANESIERYQALMKEEGPSAACYFGIAFSLEILGNNERAVFNYQQSIHQDSNWYPSYFGLSQIYYQQGDQKNGDHNFYLFENAAPYNVYGNFETHRRLSREFLEEQAYTKSAIAISTLAEWWHENKGFIPQEIFIYEKLTLSRIYEDEGKSQKSKEARDDALRCAKELLNDSQTEEGILYFVAKALEEYSELKLAYQFYKKILRIGGSNPKLVQKIGSQFLAMGDYEAARELFEEAYLHFPDHPDVRFCLLVAKLKIAEVNVEEYLIGKERLKQLLKSESDKVEILALLHTLLAKFKEDPDVHFHMGDVYANLENPSRAEKHFREMYRLDHLSKTSAIKFVSFLMKNRFEEEAITIVDKLVSREDLNNHEIVDLSWLRADYYARRGDHAKSQKYLSNSIVHDPWNVSYVTQEVINLSNLSTVVSEEWKTDSVLNKLASLNEAKLDWASFDLMTAQMEAQHAYDVVYSRNKLRYLYSDGDEEVLESLVSSACRHDPERATFDFLRLLNTNFDSPAIYWALGILYKELWQLEAASMWFEQNLLHPKLSDSDRWRACIELADCYVWLNKNLEKAVQNAKFVVELEVEERGRAGLILAHAYLKSGKMREAESTLAELVVDESLAFEKTYLLGLVQYRNGAGKTANTIWKPLLAQKSESIRIHNIKQEILSYYFDAEPYLNLKVN